MIRLKEVIIMMRGFGWYYGNGFGGFGIFGLISSILFWIVIVLIIVAVIRYLTGGHPEIQPDNEPPPPKGEPPLEILKRRYAAGDINKKQFEEMKKDILL